MKKFNHPDFQRQLSELIADLEKDSQIEVVVLIKNKSAAYNDVAITLGAVFSLVTLSYLCHAETLFDEYVAYLLALAAFGIGFLLGLLPLLQRLFTRSQRKQRNVEIMARALFQKGGLQHTSTEIGTLIYLSLLEKKTFIVADRGAQMAIPAEEWQKINQQLQNIFNTNNPAQALLTELAHCNATFARYIPALANNINELPNDLQIEL